MSVVAVDLAGDDPGSFQLLLDGVDNLVSVCTWTDTDPPPAIALSNVAFRVRDVDGDGWSDVEITARVRRGMRTPALARACAAWNARAPVGPAQAPYWAIGPARPVQLEFRMEGNLFVPIPDTRETLEKVFAGYDGDGEAKP